LHVPTPEKGCGPRAKERLLPSWFTAWRWCTSVSPAVSSVPPG
jgi:hypothetical protein